MDPDFCISSAYVMSGKKLSFCLWNIPGSGGGGGEGEGVVKQKKHEKNKILAFKLFTRDPIEKFD